MYILHLHILPVFNDNLKNNINNNVIFNIVGNITFLYLYITNFFLFLGTILYKLLLTAYH